MTTARSLLYQEFPTKWVWVKRTKKWKVRVKGQPAVGRMYFVHPAAGERFYTRLLLTVIKGATSFADLRTYEGVVYSTNQEACQARGLLQNDTEWKDCLEDARHMQTGSALQSLFATILKDCQPAQPFVLWEQFKEYLCDDIKYRLQTSGILADPRQDQIEDYGLYLIDKILFHAGVHDGLKHFLGMPIPNYGLWEGLEGNRLIREQRAFDAEEQQQLAAENIAKMNGEQAEAFNTVKTAIYENNPQMFFLHGPAGTGKTFTYKTLCYALRGDGKIVLCVASSGIAALLLPNGRTAHSTFKIPIEMFEGKGCSVKKNSDLGQLLRETSLIIWDEVPMQDRFCQEAVDMTMRDIKDKDIPFGGVTVVFGGDFQQILPVVRKGRREQVVGQCIQ